jgi:hypothetical protein
VREITAAGAGRLGAAEQAEPHAISIRVDLACSRHDLVRLR